MRVSFKTLGCRLNQYETDALVSGFDRAGYQIVDFKDMADVTIINTCTVTGQSDHKSRNIIQQAIHNNPRAAVVVTGCMAEQYQQELEQIPGIAMVINNRDKSGIVEKVETILGRNGMNTIPSGVFSYQPVQKSLHTRAAIKIQDGCDNFCTFCIIPQVRGRAISRPVDEILENMRQSIDLGFKELIITGVNIGRYEYEGTRFTSLLEKILEIPGDFRVRISSLEPDGFGPAFLQLFQHPKLTQHLHLCLQSGSDQVLLKMRRMYSISNYLELIERIKSDYSDFNLTTDIIVGFPGETDQNFEETLRIVKQIGFSHVHTFKYSIRQGTYAERMPNQVDEKTKNQRSEELRMISEQNKMNYYQQFIGKTERILIEKPVGNDWHFGYGQHYIPIQVNSQIILKNQWLDVKLNRLTGNQRIVLVGEPIVTNHFNRNRLSYTYEH
ncbi:MAG: tRNA (N(6)-L-threonylcarbamoyladenosine(37)-C(2))-methylthiotransferase MtaB [Salinivirgaceae bacterium]|jgi:threonylcarbamoyladenosine tRNA methylthiotransferase MtaB